MDSKNKIKDGSEDERPVAYPKPTEADTQLNNQPEYIDQEPGSFEKEISDVPGENADRGPQTRKP